MGTHISTPHHACLCWRGSGIEQKIEEEKPTIQNKR